MCNFPLSYLLLYQGFSPLSTVMAAILIQLVCLVARLLLMKSMIVYSIRDFLFKVLFPLIVVTCLSGIFPYIISSTMTIGLSRFIINVVVTEFVLTAIIYTFGLHQSERQLIHKTIVNIKKKLW